MIVQDKSSFALHLKHIEMEKEEAKKQKIETLKENRGEREHQRQGG